MAETLRQMGRVLRKLHRDERGADMVEYILIIAAIALPLLAIVLIFRNQIWEWMQSLFEDIKSDAEEPLN